MKRIVRLLTTLLTLLGIASYGQSPMPCDSIQNNSIKGFHIGIVQPILSLHKNKVNTLREYDFYSIGFPLGITLKTRGHVLIDLELVPFIKPYINDDKKPYDISFLYHPGILFPARHGFTFGVRAAFDSGNDQFGFTPLVNKGFELSQGTKLFIELVFPGRFGPVKADGYTQAAGVHVGLAF